MTEQHVSEQYDEQTAPEVVDSATVDEGTDESLAEPTVETTDDVPADEPTGDESAVEATDETDEPADEPVETDDSDASVDEAPSDPLEEFRRALWAKPGDWYVVHTYSGMENRVKANLENRIISLNMEDYIHEIVVPIEEVAEIKNGQRELVKRACFRLRPGPDGPHRRVLGRGPSHAVRHRLRRPPAASRCR